jgi:hypothetical protein
VAQRAQRLAAGVDLVADHHHVVPFGRPGSAGRTRLRRHALGHRAEIGGEATLVVFTEILIAEQEHGVLVPGIHDLAQRILVERAAEIDPANFRPDLRVQLGDRDSLGPFRQHRHDSLP